MVGERRGQPCQLHGCTFTEHRTGGLIVVVRSDLRTEVLLVIIPLNGGQYCLEIGSYCAQLTFFTESTQVKL